MNKKKRKITLLDVFVGLFLSVAVVFIAHRVKTEMHYNWEWDVIWQYLIRFDPETGRWTPNLLLEGFFTTVRLSVWGTLAALFFGISAGLFRTGNSLFYRLAGKTYVEMIRNLPPLVLIFIFYYFISNQVMPFLDVSTFARNLPENKQAILTILFAPPQMFEAFLSAVVTLALFEGAYIAEIVRAGIQSIEKGQWEASAALGMNRRKQMVYVILPQAAKRSLPPLAGQFISTIKDSAIVSIISIPELTFQGMELTSATYMTFEIWITVTLLYLSLTLTCSLMVRRLELWMK